MIEARPSHAAVLAAIHAAAFPSAEAWCAEDFAAQLRLPGVTGLFHPDGGVILFRVTAEEAEILTLAVVPRARRRGVGGAILGAAVALAASKGARTMFLEVAEDNRPALSLYRNAGFRECGRRPAYYPGGGNGIIQSADLLQPRVEYLAGDATAGKS